jgi:uncharacterized membrane protein YqiK
MSALRELQRRYRRESGTITLAKEIYEAAVDAIKDCKRKDRERRVKAKEKARAKAKKAREEAEAKRKAEVEERAKKAKEEAEAKARAKAAAKAKAKREKEEVEEKNSTASGSWQGKFETKYTVLGQTGTIKGMLVFTIEEGQVRGQIGEGKNSAPIKGRVSNGHIQMRAVINGGEGEQVKIVLSGKIKDNGTVKGKGTYSQPEWACIAEELGKAIGGGTGGRRCPIANYPAWWSAHKK